MEYHERIQRVTDAFCEQRDPVAAVRDKRVRVATEQYEAIEVEVLYSAMQQCGKPHRLCHST